MYTLRRSPQAKQLVEAKSGAISFQYSGGTAVLSKSERSSILKANCFNITPARLISFNLFSRGFPVKTLPPHQRRVFPNQRGTFFL
jgi:hypothetical protein